MSEDQHKGLVPVLEQVLGGVTVQTVDGRDLHEALGVKRDFTNWAKQQIARLRLSPDRDYRGEVYATEGVNPRGGRPGARYWFTLDAAKHIAMMTNSERGFEVREYFIECERRALELRPAPAPRRGTIDPTGEVVSQDPAWAAWLGLPAEERRTRQRDALIFKQATGVVGMRWAMWNVGMPVPPPHILGLREQHEMDLFKRSSGRSILVQVTEGGTH